jgi:MFS transporter
VYQLDIASLRSVATLRPEPRRRFRVSRTILLLGCVSCLTDISSEMVSSILPIYMLVQLQFSPLQFGIIDGLYQGVGAVARLGSGLLADRWHRHKLMAGIGYAMSALCKLGLLVIPGSPASLATMIAIDRTGKGVRTAPRDAMISLNAPPSNLAAGFAVHRAFDTAGVIIGPLVAYLVLQSLSDGFDVVFAVTVLMDGIECPSLSPDETRIAFKKKTGVPGTWRPAVLNLETGAEITLPESRSVDDQIEWLDNNHLLYAVSERGVATAKPAIWMVPADGTDSPKLFVLDAESPAVVRREP